MSADKLTPEELDEIMLCMRSGLRMDRQDQARIASHIQNIEAELAAKDAALAEAREVIRKQASLLITADVRVDWGDDCGVNFQRNVTETTDEAIAFLNRTDKETAQ